jgi:glycosyltransferase involved in cell wall biosynthesis
MIVKDEEPVLDRCLAAVCRFADELIIVDTGSKDQSRNIALRYTDRVYDFPWTGDFSEARNVSFSYATCDYVMWIDADDVVADESVAALLDLKRTIDPKTDVVFCLYKDDPSNLYAAQVLRDRIWRRVIKPQWTCAVNEGIQLLSTHIRYTAEDVIIIHDKVHVNNPDRNINIYEGLRKSNGPFHALYYYYYARDLFAHNRTEEALEFLRPHIDDESNSYLPEIIMQYVQCLLHLNRGEEAFPVLLHTLSYERPRAHVCCWIGKLLMAQSHYDAAIFWFETALNLPKFPPDLHIDYIHCHSLIPYQQLVKCHFKLGNLEEAAHYNELAALIRPDSQAITNNRMLFSMLVEEK